jgi:tRNA 2-thiouridine synthesizing protein A
MLILLVSRYYSLKDVMIILISFTEVVMADLKDQAPDETLDVTGKALPYPLYLTRKKLGLMEQGKVLKVISDAPESAEESIPRYAEKMGYQIQSVKLVDKWELYIRKS